uniref:Pentraxin (PTX) domain-containing protein n=1 Tax=Fundulus heteroclitus TaxID=8078 RepID=A0A3Q2TDD3_FUNHE
MVINTTPCDSLYSLCLIVFSPWDRNLASRDIQIVSGEVLNPPVPSVCPILVEPTAYFLWQHLFMTIISSYIRTWQHKHLMSMSGVRGLSFLDYKLSVWHSVCSTRNAESGIGQLWFDGKFVSGSQISQPIVILGQEQGSYGGGLEIQQSFVGMISDVNMWDYILSPCEMHHYVAELTFSPGNVSNWMALTFDKTKYLNCVNVNHLHH